VKKGPREAIVGCYRLKKSCHEATSIVRSPSRSFSSRKEKKALSANIAKRMALNKYASVIPSEKAKRGNKTKKALKKTLKTLKKASDSNTDLSVQLIDARILQYKKAKIAQNKTVQGQTFQTRKPLTKQSFGCQINMMAKKRPKKKILEMLATVLQQQHKKISKSKKAKKSTKKQEVLYVDDYDSDSDESTTSINATDNKQMYRETI
jgi:hypothetical protein